MVAGSGTAKVPAKAGTAEAAKIRAVAIIRSMEFVLYLLLAADETLDEIGPARAQPEQGHGCRLGHHNNPSHECRPQPTHQHQRSNKKTNHSFHPLHLLETNE